MRRLAIFAARLYPAAWRRRYGIDFHRLLEDMKPSWSDVFDILKGGLQMQFGRYSLAAFAVTFGVIGALGGGIAAFAMPERFESKGQMAVQRLENPSGFEQLAKAVFSRTALKHVIEKHNLYRRDRADLPLEAVVDRMRRDIRVQLAPAGTVEVAFAYADRKTAQLVTQEIIDTFVKENVELHAKTGRQEPAF